VAKRKRKMTRNKMSLKEVYQRERLNVFSDQWKWVKEMNQDTLFMELLKSENRVYYNIVKSTWDRVSYSSAPIVKLNLRTACEKYAEYKEILK
jgi:asparagine synthetase A